MKGYKTQDADNQPKQPRQRKSQKNVSRNCARTAGKRNRGAALTILGNMTAAGCSRSFAGQYFFANFASL